MWPRSASEICRASASPATTTSNDIVQGIVLMRRGAESVPTIKRVEAEVDKINKSGILPPGVSIERIYDRSDLISITTRTVLHNMVAGIVLIFLLQWAFLGNLRSAMHRRHDHPVRAVLRHRAHGVARRIGESPVGRRHRFRAGGRCHGDHGGEHLPTPGRGVRASGYRTEPTAPHARAERLSRQDGHRIARPPPRSASRFSSPRRSSSRASCRCSRCRGSKDTYSGRWRRPMRTPSPAA